MSRPGLTPMRWAIAVAAVTLSLCAPAALRAQPAAATPTLHDLSSVDELRALFDAANGKLRVVMLLSPT